MSSPWHSLIGTPGYLAGVSGSFALPAGAVLIAVTVHATTAGSLVILGGQSIPIPAGVTWKLDLKHANFVANSASSTIVATGTDSVFIHWNRQGNA